MIDNNKFTTLSKYDNDMIEKYKDLTNNAKLKIFKDQKLKSLDFIQTMNIRKLELEYCLNIIPKIESNTIQQLKIEFCDIQSVQNCQLENLLVLVIQNNYMQETETLMQEIIRFYQLKVLYLGRWSIDISPLSQMTGLTKLGLKKCELRGMQALRQLVNLVSLDLSYNKDIDITLLQYMIKLKQLSLISCGLVAIDALRPLVMLKELHIFFNSIVYISPILELKQLSTLYAEENKFQDVQIIQQHQNFEDFILHSQLQPTQQELLRANMMQNINNPISSLKYIRKYFINLKVKQTIFKQKITELLQKQYCTQQAFIVNSVCLYQKMNEFDNIQ
ncbi:internalin_A [Hexamita inflata]|uniref:Internalin_A n=1 Tax=Hexamita inflata TaxID=28002 RepID=A0ABP1KDU3_9EUKA